MRPSSQAIDAAGLRRGTFSRSALASAFTTALDFGTLTALVELFAVNYVLATWIGTVVGSLSNFTINRVWAFAAREPSGAVQFARFLVVQAVASFLHTAGVWTLTRFLGLPYQASKVVISLLVYLGWNYPMNRWFVFRHPAKASR
ncbi:MAG: GtrA family protein [Polyangia bacterium]|jgi:putative flippase GtrA